MKPAAGRQESKPLPSRWTHRTNVTQEVGQLKLTMDYSQHGSDGWMQAAISCGQDQMPDLTGAERVTMDVSYELSKLTDGAIGMTTLPL